jgi:alkyl hydroperoxide reductase subunit F
MYDLIIVGGGPAGLTAAVYAIRKRLNVMLISEDLGGKTNYHMEWKHADPYQVIRGVEIVDRFKRELEYLDFAHHIDKVLGVERNDEGFLVRTESGGTLMARALIMATGTRQKLLNVPGEKEFLGRGVSYSALSYAPLFIDKKAAVVGDGGLALRSAAELATVANHVHLIGASENLLDSPLGRKLDAAPNVTLLLRHQVTAIRGNGYADRVMLQGPDGSEVQLEVDGTFVEQALVPNTDMLTDFADLDERGFIKVDCYARTDVPGMFAAGDVTHIYAEQVLVAVGEGVKAALSAYEYLLPKL